MLFISSHSKEFRFDPIGSTGGRMLRLRNSKIVACNELAKYIGQLRRGKFIPACQLPTTKTKRLLGILVLTSDVRTPHKTKSISTGFVFLSLSYSLHAAIFGHSYFFHIASDARTFLSCRDFLFVSKLVYI